MTTLPTPTTPAAPVKLTGTPIGTAGSYNNVGNTVAKAFDGDVTTFVDLPASPSYMVGLDLGTPAVIASISYTPRKGYASRMLPTPPATTPGVFKGANKPDYSDAVTLATISSAVDGKSTTLQVSVATAFRYVIYIAPGNSHGNVSELVFVGTPVPASSSLPATFVTGVGAAAVVQATYAVGQSPAVAYCDARALGDLRNDTFAWDFGSPGTVSVLDPKTQSPLDLNTSLHGPIAQFPYESAGTYTIKLTVTKPDGSTQSFSVAAIVAADARKHYFFSASGSDTNAGTDAQTPLTGAKFAALASQSNVYLTAIDETPVALPSTVQLCSNVVIDGPFVFTCVDVGFAGWPGRTDSVVIRGVTATSVGTTATMDGGYDYTTSNADFLNVRGTRIAIIGVSIGTIGRAVYPCDAAVDGLLILNLKQLDPRTIKSQALALFDGSRICVYGCTILGSCTESGVRLETSGSGFAAEYNLFSEDIDAAEGVSSAKAGIVTRNAQDAFYGGNVIRDSEFSITAGGADEGGVRHTTTNSRVTNNLLASPNALAFITIEAGAIGCTVDNNTIDRSNGPAIQIVPTSDGSWPCTDIVIKDNHLTGTAARFDVQHASATTVVPAGTIKPAVAGEAAAVTLIGDLVTDSPFTSGLNSAVMPAAVSPVDVLNK